MFEQNKVYSSVQELHSEERCLLNISIQKVPVTEDEEDEEGEEDPPPQGSSVVVV